MAISQRRRWIFLFSFMTSSLGLTTAKRHPSQRDALGEGDGIARCRNLLGPPDTVTARSLGFFAIGRAASTAPTAENHVARTGMTRRVIPTFPDLLRYPT